MAKILTVRISDQDYKDLVDHFVHGRLGKPLVGVEAVIDSLTEGAIETAKRASEHRTRTVTQQQAEYIANKNYDDAYSSERYGPFNWRKAAAMLARKKFTADEIDAILRSKWMRWAADAAGRGNCQAKAEDLSAWLKGQRNVFSDAAKMAKESK